MSSNTAPVGRVAQRRMETAAEAMPASPEFVLDVLRDSHRHQCSVDPEADPGIELSFDTTVAEWRDACDLVGTQKLAEALNDVWGLTIPAAEWTTVLAPPHARTLRDVCGLIASHARQTTVRSAGHFGASSRTAGAFLAVRSLLLRAGADPLSVKPSLPIAELARRYPDVFLGPISRLAPGRLPTVVIRTPIYDAAVVACGAGLLGLLGLSVAGWLGLTRSRTALGLTFAIVAGLGFAGTWFATRVVGPSAVTFGSIVTFRDLAQVIAGEAAGPDGASGPRVTRPGNAVEDNSREET